MGAGPSKTAAQSTVRKFPNRAPGAAVPPSRRPPPPPVSNAVRGGVKGAPPEDPYVSRAREDPVASQFQPEGEFEIPSLGLPRLALILCLAPEQQSMKTPEIETGP